jgi:hypothetical protein
MNTRSIKQISSILTRQRRPSQAEATAWFGTDPHGSSQTADDDPDAGVCARSPQQDNAARSGRATASKADLK